MQALAIYVGSYCHALLTQIKLTYLRSTPAFFLTVVANGIQRNGCEFKTSLELKC